MTLSVSPPLPDIFFPSDKILPFKVVRGVLSLVPKRFCTCPTHSFFMISMSPKGLLLLTSLKDEVSPSPIYETHLFLPSDLLKLSLHQLLP